MKNKLIPALCIVIVALLAFCKANAQIITTVAGRETAGFSGDDSAATSAQLNSPYGVAVDNNGNIFIADNANNRIRKVNTSGIITTIAGTGIPGFMGDSGPATAALLSSPVGIAVDKYRNIYFSDRGNYRVRKIDTFGVITTIAGAGGAGFDGDGVATAVQLNHPWGVATDNSGNVYVADELNQRIRKIDPSGMMTTIAGNGSVGFSGEGLAATTAEMQQPTSIAVDNSGNVYIADASNFRVRMINTSGIITTIAGNGTGAYLGEGSPASAAELRNPISVALDSIGNLYIDDGNRIRKIAHSTGLITTVAGNGTAGFTGDNAPATNAEINSFFGSAVIDDSGNIYIADDGNNRIRKVKPAASTTAVSGTPSKNNGIAIYPNPVSDLLTIKIQSLGNENSISITDMNGKIIASQKNITTPIISFQTRNLPPGIYLVSVITDSEEYCGKVIVERN